MLRRGEICGLKWSDVNFNDRTLTIKRSVSKKSSGGIRIGETKTGAGTRTMVLPPSVITLLEEKEQITQWIFPHTMNPEEPLHPDTAYRKLKTILKREGLPLIRFYDLRHTFATTALANGMDIKTLSSIIGTYHRQRHSTYTCIVQTKCKRKQPRALTEEFAV